MPMQLHVFLTRPAALIAPGALLDALLASRTYKLRARTHTYTQERTDTALCERGNHALLAA